MRHFLFEDKEYKLRFDFKARRDRRDSAKELLRLIRLLSGDKRRGAAGVRRGADSRQKCIAKMQYSDNRDAHKKQLESYLTREGTEQDGGNALLFGTDMEIYKEHMVDKNFRIFLSPQSEKTDLKKLAKDFITKLESQTGFKLYWQGACHYNTAHPHAHLLINGVDQAGREVKFSRDIVKTFMRETGRDLCTVQLGRRTRRDMEIEKERELEAPRWTKTDGRLKVLCSGGLCPDLSILGGTEKPRFLARLDTLRKLGLCVYERGGYRLGAKWEEDLKANGRYNTFLAAREEMNAPDLRVYSGAEGSIAGRVVKVYRTDGDASDNHAVLLKGADGKSWFIPLFRKPELRDGLARTELKAGECVSIKTYKTQKGRLTPYIFKNERLEKEFEHG